MKSIVLAIIIFLLPIGVYAQKVSIKAIDQPAATVFRSIIEQTGKNFVYSSELLEDVRLTLDVHNKPLRTALEEAFKGTDIEFKIKGKNVILRRKKAKKLKTLPHTYHAPQLEEPSKDARMLDEVIVVSRLESPAVETPEIGAKKITIEDVRNTPVLLGENDVIKTIQAQPGVVEGTEGLAGMYVHGGNADENLFMLDNVPLYQVNHFAGFFSAFNPEIIRYIDFFKTSVPAKYDGRLSSFMDVRLMNGNTDGHHGTAKLGLTSGALNISGPIGKRTTYLVGLRRSWYDVLTIPLLALVNAKNEDESIRFHYYFMDFNAKISHRFSSKANAFISFYYGDDMLRTGSDSYNFYNDDIHDLYKERYNFNWGNMVVQGGLNYRIRPNLVSEFTAAYTRYFSSMEQTYRFESDKSADKLVQASSNKTKNNINDWIFRGDFDWQAGDNSRVRFGLNYVRHTFLPGHTSKEHNYNDYMVSVKDSTWAYGANEFNAYIEDDWKINERFHLNAGIHASLFNIDKKTHHGISPRFSMSYKPKANIAVKAAYTRTVQYVHQVTQSYLALPTDHWLPISGNQAPQTADKVSVGGYWQSNDNHFSVSVEAYYKQMHNLIEYCDEYYLKPPLEIWNARLTSGKGSAKGIDFKIEKVFGRLTGHISYSLAWADRTFKEKNNGLTYPARFDNRHTINILATWKINNKVSLSASWVGHSGNRFTLMPQVWEAPVFVKENTRSDVALRTKVNNYQLPFYHRLDLSCEVRNSRGFWTFGLYNAYCHMNTIAIKRGVRTETSCSSYPYGCTVKSTPVFQKVKLFPIIPSISYTWQF